MFGGMAENSEAFGEEQWLDPPQGTALDGGHAKWRKDKYDKKIEKDLMPNKHHNIYIIFS